MSDEPLEIATLAIGDMSALKPAEGSIDGKLGIRHMPPLQGMRPALEDNPKG